MAIERLRFGSRLVSLYKSVWPTRKLLMFLPSIIKLNRLSNSYLTSQFIIIREKLRGRQKRCSLGEFSLLK